MRLSRGWRMWAAVRGNMVPRAPSLIGLVLQKNESILLLSIDSTHEPLHPIIHHDDTHRIS